MKEFDPKRLHSKHRSMNGVHFEQDGCKFNAGGKYVGKLAKTGEVVVPEVSKEDVRARARAKIAAKTGDLDGFKPRESTLGVENMLKENDAAKQAEDLVE